jgi:hypothetical protein
VGVKSRIENAGRINQRFLSFADSHVEWWKWRDGALRFNGSYWYCTTPGDRDLQRLQEALPQP